jgi:uncharacterized protein YraI
MSMLRGAPVLASPHCAIKNWRKKMKRIVIALGALLMAASLTGPAEAAATGYAKTHVNLRAGPSTAFPPLGVVPAGAQVIIHGCLDGWTWCDTSWGQLRGWVYGTYLAAHYQGQRIRVVEVAPRLGLPVISFHFGTYWDRHYRDRPIYRDRSRWERRYSERRSRDSRRRN